MPGLPHCRRAALLVLLGPLGLLALAAPASSSTRGHKRSPARPANGAGVLLRSSELWATIDVCNTAKQPDTVGVRGSMPGDGHARDELMMSFRLEYLNAVNQWVELEGAASSAFIDVGDGAATRQGGTSFTLKPHAGKSTFKLRGVVLFKWMHGKTIVETARKPTTALHEATEGAEPKGFSAAECSVG
jgi:hypothetical protein